MSTIKNRIAATVAASGLLAAAGLAGTTPAQAAESADKGKSKGTSLAEVLAADGNKFDKNKRDFDVLDRAVRVVLGAKPGSAVGVLADPSVKLTAFLPKDGAFIRLANNALGADVKNERAAFKAIAGALDVDTIETVLLYHVVPGKKLAPGAVAASDGAELTTAQGGTVTVRVNPHAIRLVDQDPDARNAKVGAVDINKSRKNKQIGHAINQVLRPVDL